MKTASVREFRGHLAELLESGHPLLITRHAKNVAIVYSLKNPAIVPLEVRREVVDSVARALSVHPDWVVHSPVVEAYKRGVDRTLIRENLKRSPQERLEGLEAMQRLAAEVRRG